MAKTKSPNTIDDQVKASIAGGKLKDRRAKKRKMMFRAGGFVLLVAFLYWAYIALFTYQKGGMGYGICKVFLELHVQYPTELRLSYADILSRRMRIWYAQHDSYGQTRFDAMDCYFQKDNLILEKVTINRREVDPAIVARFNKSIPTLFSYPPDLTYPMGLPDDIKELKTGN